MENENEFGVEIAFCKSGYASFIVAAPGFEVTVGDIVFAHDVNSGKEYSGTAAIVMHCASTSCDEFREFIKVNGTPANAVRVYKKYWEESAE